MTAPHPDSASHLGPYARKEAGREMGEAFRANQARTRWLAKPLLIAGMLILLIAATILL